MSSQSLPYEPDGQRAESSRRSFTPARGMPPVAPEAARAPANARPGAHPSAHAGSRPSARSRIQLTRPHHPRVLAALCYTVPVVPAWMLLARGGSERANPFVRFHAAQALVFQGVIAASQIILYLLLVIPGGLVTNDTLAIGLAGLLLVLYLAQAAVIAVVWSSLMADCIRGDARLLPVLGAWALRLEAFAPRALWARWRGRASGAR